MEEYSSEKAGVHWISTTNDTGTDYGKYLMEADPETGILVKEDIYPHQYRTIWHTHTCGHGIFLLEGKLYTDRGILKPGQFIWWPAGIHMEHGGTETEDADILHMSDARFDLTLDPEPEMKPDSHDPSVIVKDTGAMEWETRTAASGMDYYEKNLLDTDRLYVSLLRLPCGFETGKVRGSVGHGFFVLHGIVKTQSGFYGPRSFAWDPRGMEVCQGAGKFAEAQIIYLSAGKAEYTKL